MRALVDDGVFDAAESVEDDCASPALDIVERGIGSGQADCCWNSPFVDIVQYPSHAYQNLTNMIYSQLRMRELCSLRPQVGGHDLKQIWGRSTSLF